MQYWQILAVVGVCFAILEMFTPSLFFLNFALAAFISAACAVFIKSVTTLVIIFFILSFVSFIFLRPILVKKFNKSTETGINSKYIGQTVKAETDITYNSGCISIYGERWEARTENGNVIPAGSDVKIVRNESLIMYVE